MTNDEFDALVKRLEAVATRDPAGYRRRVVALALLGYGYLAAMLAILAGLLLAAAVSVTLLKAVAVKLVIVIGAFIALVLKAMWVRLDPPAGREISPAQAPALFDAIERLRRALEAPAFHRVLLTDEFNAAVMQVPRLGMLGWHRNYLLIGLPLMKALTVEQLESVLAHEFGHLSHGHGRLSNWIYRLRMSWARLMGVLEYQRSWGTFMFRRFFNWYVPYFSACSFPLARANEYEADAVAARLTSPQTMAEALTGVNVAGSFLGERYWPEVYRHADDAPQPALAPFSALGARFSEGLDATAAHSWMERALGQQTGTGNTHPSLSDRLKALGASPRLALPAPGAAADRLLGGALAGLAAEFDARWRESIRPAWEQRHHEVRVGRTRLSALDTQAGERELDPAEAFERARLTEEFGGNLEAALTQFRALHERAPESPVYACALGVRLLARDDAAGAPLVEQAVAREERLIVPGAEALRDFHWRGGREAEARSWHARADERAEVIRAARAERDIVYTSDKFETHGLAEADIAELRHQLAAIPGLRKVYLVRKRVQHLAHHPFYVLAFKVTPWWRRSRQERLDEMQRTILETVRLPGETMVFGAEREQRQFADKFRYMRGSRIL